MEVVVRRDGSLKVKFDGDQISLGLRVIVEGNDEREKVQTLRNLIERLNKYGSVVGTCYKLNEQFGEFMPVRRRRDGSLVEDHKRNIGFFSTDEVTNWLVEKQEIAELLKKAL